MSIRAGFDASTRHLLHAGWRLTAVALVIASGACSEGVSNPGSPDEDSETITWLVTGTIVGDDDGNRFTVGWSIRYPNGGQQSLGQRYQSDGEMLFKKEETLEKGSVVTLAVNPLPDNIDPKDTFTLDLRVKLMSEGEIVATESFRETVAPTDSRRSLPAPPLSYTVGG